MANHHRRLGAPRACLVRCVGMLEFRGVFGFSVGTPWRSEHPHPSPELEGRPKRGARSAERSRDSATTRLERRDLPAFRLPPLLRGEVLLGPVDDLGAIRVAIPASLEDLHSKLEVLSVHANAQVLRVVFQSSDQS